MYYVFRKILVDTPINKGNKQAFSPSAFCVYSTGNHGECKNREREHGGSHQSNPLQHNFKSTRSIDLLGILNLGLAAGLGLLLLLLLQEEKSLDLVGDGVLSNNGLLDLLTADQGGNNGSTDNEGQDETVHAVPVGSTAGGSSTSVVVVKEGEGEELGDQSILSREKQSRPSHGRGDHTGSVTAVAELAAVASPLKTPVDSTEEGEDLDEILAGKFLN